MGEYWWFILYQFLASFVLFAVLVVRSEMGAPAAGADVLDSTGMSPIGSVILYGGLTVIIAPTISLTIRRLHDSDRSGWWCFAYFVPLGGLLMLIFMLTPGTPGRNRFGPAPGNRRGHPALDAPLEGAALEQAQAARSADMQDYYRTKVLGGIERNAH